MMRMLGNVRSVEANEFASTPLTHRAEVVGVAVTITLDDDLGLLTLWLPKKHAPQIGEEIALTVDFEEASAVSQDGHR